MKHQTRFVRPNEPGYRYVRQYWTKAGNQNWALWEYDGVRCKRVGTARSVGDYRAFLADSRVAAEKYRRRTERESETLDP